MARVVVRKGGGTWSNLAGFVRMQCSLLHGTTQVPRMILLAYNFYNALNNAALEERTHGSPEPMSSAAPSLPPALAALHLSAHAAAAPLGPAALRSGIRRSNTQAFRLQSSQFVSRSVSACCSGPTWPCSSEIWNITIIINGPIALSMLQPSHLALQLLDLGRVRGNR
eukprot:1159607-Pelagomonas_calceolata.AAC.1